MRETNMMQKTEGCTPEELLFYIYFAVMLLCKGLGLVDGPLYRLCLAGSSLLVLAKLLVDKYTAAEYALSVLLLALGAAVMLSSHNQGVLLCVLPVVAMKHIDLRRCCREAALFWGGAFVLRVLTQLAGLGSRDFVIHDKLRLGYVIRWALGYSHPNVLMIAYVVLLFYLGCTLRPEGRELWRFLTAALLGGGYIFLYSLSVTGLLFLFIFLALAFLFDAVRRREERVQSGRQGTGHPSALLAAERLLIRLVFPAAAGISVIGPLTFKGRLFDFFNRLLNTRFFLSKYMLTRENLSLFGRDLFDATLTLDCSYTNLLISGGSIAFVLMAAAYLLLIHDMIKDMDTAEGCFAMAGTLALLVAGMSEPFLFNTSFKNATLPFMGCYLYRRLARSGGREYRIIRLPEMLRALIRRKTAELSVWIMKKQLRLRDAALRLRAALLRRKGAAAALFLAGALCGVWAGLCLVRVPSVVYAPRSSSTADDTRKNLYFTREQVAALEQTQGAAVLGYRDEMTPMQEFADPGLARMERLRAAGSLALAGGCAGLLITGICPACPRRRTRRKS
ncbi:hypothetical protein [Lachnoclostridium sp. Marseille-P6806]|uniref:hypothetical protein n=1 Tax=Lachnoclostridium sp. Marseille-P6806 TaxID=2364793 RepID=UPI0010300535|nr:hypothetical protein [Lachnoclostridium sp. Marseille-P6806]